MKIPSSTLQKAPVGKNASASLPGKKPAPLPAGGKSAKPLSKIANPFRDDIGIGFIENENFERLRNKAIYGIIFAETIIIAILSLFFVFGQPFFQPRYQYIAKSPENHLISLAPLPAPNMTNRAIMAWTASSITEIMTFGFGDMDQKLVAQKRRFTIEGWDAFVKSFLNSKADVKFRGNQLVLTTIPSDMPEIVSQGMNERQIYQWKVTMPIIMTYATNNNVTRKDKSTVNLTIVRSRDHEDGIAIETFDLQ